MPYLARQGIISQPEKELIVKGLEEIMHEIEAGQLQFTVEAEDVHMNIETFLTQKIGEVGKKLHTARSRNDQVALDVRLYLRDEMEEIQKLLLRLQEVLLDLASEHLHTIMPGYTHLQKAQPLNLAHHLLAYFEMLRRDLGRLEDCRERMDYMPLAQEPWPVPALTWTGIMLGKSWDLGI
jgi:argininosuccinate lyase